MPLQFSKVEEAKLYSSWLAWENIEAQEFLRGFEPLWRLAMDEVEALFKQASYRCRLKEVGKVGLTIQPNISFAFSPIKRGYFINVWSLFFCFQPGESSVFFRPAFLLANEMLHEYTHYRFWLDHGKLDADKETKERFDSEHGLENEKNALTEELNFLRKARYVVPPRVRVKFLRVLSWANNGTPICEGRLVQLETRKSINSMIRLVEGAIVGLSSKRNYDDEMTRQKAETHTSLSSALKLNVSQRDWPIVEMKI